MQKYPARWIGLAMSVLSVLTAFGVVLLTPAQLGAVSAFLVALAGVVPIIQGLFTERKVYSPETHMKELAVDYEAGYEAGKREG